MRSIQYYVSRYVNQLTHLFRWSTCESPSARRNFTCTKHDHLFGTSATSRNYSCCLPVCVIPFSSAIANAARRQGHEPFVYALSPAPPATRYLQRRIDSVTYRQPRQTPSAQQRLTPDLHKWRQQWRQQRFLNSSRGLGRL